MAETTTPIKNAPNLDGVVKSFVCGGFEVYARIIQNTHGRDVYV